MLCVFVSFLVVLNFTTKVLLVLYACFSNFKWPDMRRAHNSDYLKKLYKQIDSYFPYDLILIRRAVSQSTSLSVAD